MSVTPATILIPDISGFTDFMTSVEQEHGSHLISLFLEKIIQEVGDRFEVGEVEGDAVLLYKKEGTPSKQEIIELCRKIFSAFHYLRKMVQSVVICPCGVCQGVINLTLKFVAHHGTITEVKVDRFTKASGLDMIIAHRLLKNSIVSHEYVLLTDKFLEHAQDTTESAGLQWQSLADEFPAIGKVQYEYALLEAIKQDVPDPPRPEMKKYAEAGDFVKEHIAAPFNDVYIAVINMPNRIHWMKGLKKVVQEDDPAYIGSVHSFFFDNVKAVVSPSKIQIGDEEIFYAEMSTATDMDISFVYEYRFRKETDGCQVICRIGSIEDRQLPENLYNFLFQELQASIRQLKAYCENGFRPL